ncbi:hypothetical protein GGH19_004945 [Coemansia sp. RSA 1807]|nr:hypothetical protein LPJ67_002470 [Coemansia sp. RSA 1938]KAJ2571348.1 hypothetical protein GGH19_004945 [Coemansia sp. RSA 1807]
MEPGFGANDVYDQSIHRLLDQINERREQAAHFAQLIEQSIHHTPVASRAPVSDDDFDGRILDTSIDGSQSSGSMSPPPSFLEGFTRVFVDAYEAPEEDSTESMRSKSTSRFGRLVHGQLQNKTRVADLDDRTSYRSVSEPSDQSEYESSASVVSEYEESEDGDSEYYKLEDGDSEYSHTERVDTKSPIEVRGAAVIDRAARARLWQRVDGANPHLADQDETRISALVALSERIMAMQTTDHTVSPSKDLPTTLPLLPSPDPQNAQTPPEVTASQTFGLACWTENEWEQWADYTSNTRVVDMSEMTSRLEWVHERHPHAWQYGFSDTRMNNGKLKRTYRDVPLDIQAYTDGNVKRTAQVDSNVCTTLYFANGDWSCSVDGRAYYFYSDERVWHEQADGRSVHRYADGRVEEEVDGCVTVRFPSGDVRIGLS